MEPIIVCRLCNWEGITSQLTPNKEGFLSCPFCEHPEFRPKERIDFEPEDDDFEGGFIV